MSDAEFVQQFEIKLLLYALNIFYSQRKEKDVG